jgi:threonine dehydrogenase-like Zn-dependent dehydrogenase
MPFAAWCLRRCLGGHRIITTLCPGGKERMRRLMEVIASGRTDLKPLVMHRFRLTTSSRLMSCSASSVMA